MTKVKCPIYGVELVDFTEGRFAPTLIAAVDIGSPMAGKLGWAVLPEQRTGSSIAKLVEIVVQALSEGPVSLGFETPLWVPMRTDPMTLTKARTGEGTRSWSAGAGAGVLATGLVVIPHILSAIRKAAPSAVATLDFRHPPTQPGTLFLWEAFVSAKDKGDTHEADALIAARAFQRACVKLSDYQKIVPEPCLNLLGAALLRTGWSSELALLSTETLVVRL